MKKQKKDNAKLKEEFKNTLVNDKLDVETYRQMVDYIKNNKKIDIEMCVINTGEDIAKQKYDKKGFVTDCNEEKLWADSVTTFYIADKKGDNTRIKQSKNLEKIIFKKSDKPYGVIVLMVNNKGHLQHALSFIIIAPTEKDNQKTKIIPIEPQNRDDPFSQGDKENLENRLAAFLYDISFDLTKVELGSCSLVDIMKLYNIVNSKLKNRIDFLYPKQFPVMKDATCFFSELMILTKLLKNQGTEINKLIKADKEGTQIKFPLSIMKYTQIDSFIDYLKENYTNNDEKTQKQLDKVEEGKFTFLDNEWKKKTHNTLIYSKALKLSEKSKQQQEQAQHINKFVKDNNDLLNKDKTNKDIASKACDMVKEEQKRIKNDNTNVLNKKEDKNKNKNLVRIRQQKKAKEIKKNLVRQKKAKEIKELIEKTKKKINSIKNGENIKYKSKYFKPKIEQEILQKRLKELNNQLTKIQKLINANNKSIQTNNK